MKVSMFESFRRWVSALPGCCRSAYYCWIVEIRGRTVFALALYLSPNPISDLLFRFEFWSIEFKWKYFPSEFASISQQIAIKNSVAAPAVLIRAFIGLTMISSAGI